MQMKGPLVQGKFSVLALLLCLAVVFPGAAAAQPAEPAERQAGDPTFSRPAGGQGSVEASPDQLIVKFESSTGPQSRNDIRNAEKLEKVRDLGLIRAEVAEVNGRTVEDAVRSLERRPGVEYAEPDYEFLPTGYADESRFSELWGLENTGQAIKGVVGTPDTDVNAREASEITRGASDVVVAVMDSGINFSHPDLKDRAWKNPGESGEGRATNGVDDDANGYVDDVHGWDFYNNDNTLHDSGNDRHGTHVAGTLAASMNGEGVVGVAPNVKIMSLKILESTTSTSTAVLALEYAKAKGAKISNSSWGGYSHSQALKDAIEASGQLVVAGAGNDAYNNDGSRPFYPASYDSPNVLSVAAIDNKGGLASFSNYGAASVDLSAPGVDILSTMPGYPEKPAAVLSSVGASGGKALTAGFGAEGVDGASAQASFVRGAFGAVERGSQPVVLVDDDRSHAGYRDVGPTLSSAIEAATGSVPEVIRVPDGDGPSLSQLKGKTVLWATGQVNNSGSSTYGTMTTLTNTDQQTLTDFLNGGGRLVLAGMDALHRIETSPLVKDSLKLKVLSDVGRLSGLSSFARALEGSPGTAFAGQSHALTSSFANSTYHDSVAPADATVSRTQGLYPGIEPTWGYMSGTSMAAPHVTGSAALAASSDPAFLEGPAALKSHIMDRGRPAPATEGKTVTGDIVDALAASDVAAPTVGGVTPEDQTTGVTLDANAGATFSEAMDPSTLNNGTFTLTEQAAGTTIEATVSYDSVSREARLDPTADLGSERTYIASVKGGAGGIKDAAGNHMEGDYQWSFRTLDAAPPDAPTVDLTSDTDTGVSANDDLTGHNTPAFEGDAEASSKVSIYDGSTLLGTSTADGAGRYGFTATGGLGDGTHRITARATDAAGNTSGESASLEVRIDTAAPSAPSINSPGGAVVRDSGAYTVLGTAEADSAVDLFEEMSLKGTAKVDASGNWGAELTGLAEGNHTYTAEATDAAGNTSAASGAWALIVDAAVPTVVARSPAPGTAGVGVDTYVKATFSEPMDSNSIGTATFRLLKRRADGTIAPVPATVAYDAQSKKATLTPNNNLNRGATYIAKVTTGVKDLAGTPLPKAEVWRFMTKE